jgi:hypothetical protein
MMKLVCDAVRSSIASTTAATRLLRGSSCMDAVYPAWGNANLRRGAPRAVNVPE